MASRKPMKPPKSKPAAPMPRLPKSPYARRKPMIRVPKLDPVGDIRKGVPELIEMGKAAGRRVKEGYERIKRATR